MTAVDASPMSVPEHYVTARVGYDRTYEFILVTGTGWQQRELIVASVSAPSLGWNPQNAKVAFGHHGRAFEPDSFQCVIEILALANDFARTMNENFADEKEAYEKRRAEEEAERERRNAEYRERVRREREEREKERREKVAKVVEATKWYVGHRFRLKRDGYRATVFGTIQEVTDYGQMRTISEKGKPMTIDIAGLVEMDIKHEPTDKKYERIWPVKGENA